MLRGGSPRTRRKASRSVTVEIGQRADFRSLRTQQRAYVRGRPGIEVPATEWSLY
jgi:allophanate hydrolase subunit 2